MRRLTASSRAVALLVLLAAATPAGIVAAYFVVLALDHGLDHVRSSVAGAGGLGGGDVDGPDRAGGGDLLQRGGLALEGAAGVVERSLPTAVADRGGRRLAGFELDFGAEDQLAELLPDRVHQLLEHRE